MNRWLPGVVVVTAILVLLMTTLLIPQLRSENPQDPDVLIRVLGGTADFAAEQAYREAEIYFHAGYGLRVPG